MSNIAKAFVNGKAFIPFVTYGDPDLETTAKVVRAMAEAGADLIELGIPFSDPTAEGPVIQAANVRALASGTTTDKIFDMVRELRKDVTVPMVFMTYANVVFSYGSEKFISACADIGAMVKLIRASTKLPCAVGFGISTPEQAKKMASLSDGAIVGSAIVKLIAQYGRDAAPYVAEYVKSMKDAVRQA